MDGLLWNLESGVKEQLETTSRSHKTILQHPSEVV